MVKRWATAFTIVELLLIVLVIGIIVTISVVAYNGIRKATLAKAAQSDLMNVSAEMQRVFQATGQYPASLPSSVTASTGIQLTHKSAGKRPFYQNLSTVQNGTLLSEICDDLVAEGVGNGTSQGGQARAYITSCGNWNHDSMQVTGWTSKVWQTPVTSQALLNYADTFTAGSTWDSDQERVIKSFYHQLVDRLVQSGGTFPITSFWDYWATPSNGGVQQQPLSDTPQLIPFYCVESQITGDTQAVWHITEKSKSEAGPC